MVRQSFNIGIVTFGVDLAGAGQPGHFFITQIDFGFIGNGLCYLTVHDQHIGHGPVVCLAPQVLLFGKRVSELKPDLDTLAHLIHRPL